MLSWAPQAPGKSKGPSLWQPSSLHDFIIDDGLVIYKGSIVCGKSAKIGRGTR
jgi:hypothetical protein